MSSRPSDAVASRRAGMTIWSGMLRSGPMTKTFDVIIGGGGMVGLTLGLALARGGMTVVVADPLPKETVTGAAFDGRVSALAYAAVRMYRALGVWEHLESDAQPIEDILVTDGGPRRAPS